MRVHNVLAEEELELELELELEGGGGGGDILMKNL